MAVPQVKIREIVFQMLYSMNMGHAASDDLVLLMMNELAVSKSSVLLALKKVEAIQEHTEEIDAVIAGTAHAYDFDRIQNIEKNILRLGLFELLYDKEIPPKVVMAEAIRLTRKFGTPESASFVNAILDAAYKSTLSDLDNKP